jgi:hypothetical protein
VQNRRQADRPDPSTSATCDSKAHETEDDAGSGNRRSTFNAMGLRADDADPTRLSVRELDEVKLIWCDSKGKIITT